MSESVDGIYSLTFRGATDWGMGLLILQMGIVTGADASGVIFDGEYSADANRVLCKLRMKVPAGVALVQGFPAQPREYELATDIEIPRDALLNQSTVLLKLPHGPVNVIFQLLRKLGG